MGHRYLALSHPSALDWYPTPPITTWPRSSIPNRLPAFLSSSVIFTSWTLGVESPKDGCVPRLLTSPRQRWLAETHPPREPPMNSRSLDRQPFGRLHGLSYSASGASTAPGPGVPPRAGAARGPGAGPAHRDPRTPPGAGGGQRTRIHRQRPGGLGSAQRGEAALHYTGQTDGERHIASFIGKFRDGCLNLHWFLNLAHTRVMIEDWRSG